MLKQEYRYGVYYFDREEPHDTRLLYTGKLTVEGADRNALDLAATEKMAEIEGRLEDGQFIDDIEWDDPQEAKEPLWYPVTVSSRKHGGGLRVNSGQPVRAEQRPEDTKGDTKKMQFKTRHFSSWQEAQRIIGVIQGLDITMERVRGSVTQGEVKVFINGKHILNFGDEIVLPVRGASPEDYYGDDIGGWRSRMPDSSFVLGLIWHPLEYTCHYSERVCKAIGMTQEEWIEGDYWNREGQIWKATKN